MPGKADSQEQEKFAKKLKRYEKMYFLDGVHPTHNTRNVKVWCRKGKEKATPGENE